MEALRAVPAERAGDAIALAASIEDPLTRGAAAVEWVRLHAATLDRSQGETLCAFAEGSEGQLCARRLSAPHLQR